MPQHELLRHVADIHRVAAATRTKLIHHRFGMQPPGRLEPILADLADDLLIVENRAGSSLFYSLCQRGDSGYFKLATFRDF